MICKIDGCGSTYRVHKGLCNRHYLQIKKHGRILQTIPIINLQNEEWKELTRFTHQNYQFEIKYYISNMGRVKSSKKRRDWIDEKLLTPRFSEYDNRMIISCGVNIILRLAQEVAKVFIPNPNNDKRLIFLDKNIKNCCADNLQWYSVYWYDISFENLKKETENNNTAKAIFLFMNNDNDNEIFIEILKERRIHIHKYLWRKFNNWRSNHKASLFIDIEDLTQEVFIKAIDAIKRGLLRDATGFNKWLYVIAKNTLINACKKNTIKTVPIIQKGQDGNEYNYAEIALYSNKFYNKKESLGL